MKGGNGVHKGGRGPFPLIVYTALIISQRQSSSLMCSLTVSMLVKDKTVCMLVLYSAKFSRAVSFVTTIFKTIVHQVSVMRWDKVHSDVIHSFIIHYQYPGQGRGDV